MAVVEEGGEARETRGRRAREGGRRGGEAREARGRRARREGGGRGGRRGRERREAREARRERREARILAESRSKLGRGCGDRRREVRQFLDRSVLYIVFRLGGSNNRQHCQRWLASQSRPSELIDSMTSRTNSYSDRRVNA
jgi:hypothetical protein